MCKNGNNSKYSLFYTCLNWLNVILINTNWFLKSALEFLIMSNFGIYILTFSKMRGILNLKSCSFVRPSRHFMSRSILQNCNIFKPQLFHEIWCEAFTLVGYMYIINLIRFAHYPGSCGRLNKRANHKKSTYWQKTLIHWICLLKITNWKVNNVQEENINTYISVFNNENFIKISPEINWS